jgi:16S rRNA (uracil1498-N3)-methyltransferase
MRVSRIYCKENLAAGASIQLDSDSIHYLVNVLRLKPGTEINLFNSDAGEFRGTIVTASKKEVVVELDEQVAEPLRNSLSIHLALGLSKGDRFDYAMQKSVELGVAAITPLYTEYSEVKFKDHSRLEKKLLHWQKIAVSACEQCGSHSPPTLYAPLTLNEFAQQKTKACRLVLDKSGEGSLSELEKPEAIELLVGPEGGLSPDELGLLQSHEFQAINMGPRILRTETAPVAALAILQSVYGDL